jgi:hypothetical protein
VGTVYLPFALAHKYPNAPSEETTGSTLYLIVAIQLRLHLPLRPDVFRLGLNLRKIGDSAQWHYLRHLSSHAPSLARRGGGEGGWGKLILRPSPASGRRKLNAVSFCSIPDLCDLTTSSLRQRRCQAEPRPVRAP